MSVAPERMVKQVKRKSSMFERLDSIKNGFQDKFIDPYVLVRIGDDTQTTKPCIDGGKDPVWTDEHNKRLIFTFPSVVPQFQDHSSHDRNIYLDVFDQDILADSFIGSSVVNLKEIFDHWLGATENNMITKDTAPYHKETTLRRKDSDQAAGFLNITVEFKIERQLLVVTVNNGSDLTDPDDSSNEIQDDPAHGTSFHSAFFSVVAYFLVGALFYCTIEGWTVIDAMYFTAATFTTVGYGDVRPETDGGKLFSCLYIIVGISVISVNLVRTMLGCFHAGTECEKVLRVWLARKCSSSQQQITRHVSHEHADQILGDEEQGGGAKKEGKEEGEEEREYRNKRENDQAIMKKIKANKKKNAADGRPESTTDEQEGPTLRYMILRMVAGLVVLISIGTVWFCWFEDLTFVNGIYMSTATVATVGYGDVSPMTQGGRFFATFWIMSSYVMIIRSLHHVVDKSHELSLASKRDFVLSRDLSRTAILNMDVDGDGVLTRLEFLEFFIVKLKLCTSRQLQKIQDRYDQIEQEKGARELVLMVTSPNSKNDRGSTLGSSTDMITQRNSRQPPQQPNKSLAQAMRTELPASETAAASIDTAAANNSFQLLPNQDAATTAPRPAESPRQQLSLSLSATAVTTAVSSSAVDATTAADADADADADAAARRSGGGLYDGSHHPLSSMLAHIRRASELARADVENSIRNDKMDEAKATVKMLRQLLTLLHNGEVELLPRLERNGEIVERIREER